MVYERVPENVRLPLWVPDKVWGEVYFWVRGELALEESTRSGSFQNFESHGRAAESVSALRNTRAFDRFFDVSEQNAVSICDV